MQILLSGKIEFVTNVEYKNECIVLHEKEGKNHNVENSLKKGMVQNTQIAQMTQMTETTQICSKCLKYADDGGADADFPSACFRCLKHADDRSAFADFLYAP